MREGVALLVAAARHAVAHPELEDGDHIFTIQSLISCCSERLASGEEVGSLRTGPLPDGVVVRNYDLALLQFVCELPGAPFDAVLPARVTGGFLSRGDQERAEQLTKLLAVGQAFAIAGDRELASRFAVTVCALAWSRPEWAPHWIDLALQVAWLLHAVDRPGDAERMLARAKQSSSADHQPGESVIRSALELLAHLSPHQDASQRRGLLAAVSDRVAALGSLAGYRARLALTSAAQRIADGRIETAAGDLRDALQQPWIGARFALSLLEIHLGVCLPGDPGRGAERLVTVFAELVDQTAWNEALEQALVVLDALAGAGDKRARSRLLARAAGVAVASLGASDPRTICLLEAAEAALLKEGHASAADELGAKILGVLPSDLRCPWTFRDRCPKCGSSRLSRILYGLYAESPELKQRLATGEVVLGGCEPYPEDTTCRRCRHCF